VLLRAAYLAPGPDHPGRVPPEISSAWRYAPPPHGSLRGTEREMIDPALADTQGNSPRPRPGWGFIVRLVPQGETVWAPPRRVTSRPRSGAVLRRARR